MHLDDFEEEFLPQILYRGFDYFERGLVQGLTRSGNMWRAGVSGSELYRVEVEFSEDGEITDLSCDCPYDWDPLCKHEAAVLFELREVLEDGAIGEGGIAEPEQSLSLLQDLSRDQLISLITAMVEQNPSLGLMVRASAAEPESETTDTAERLETVNELVISAIDELMGFDANSASRLGFLGMPDYPADLLEQAVNLIQDTLKSKQYREALNLSTVVLGHLSEACYDGIDRDGELLEVHFEIFEIIKRICSLNTYSNTERTGLLVLLLDCSLDVAPYDMDSWELELLEQALSLCRTTEHAILFEAHLIPQLEQGSRSAYFSEAKLIILYRLFEQYRSKEEAAALLADYVDYPEIRKAAISRAMNEGRLADAEALAVEGELQAGQLQRLGLRQDFTFSRCRIYEVTGEVGKLREVLQELMISTGDFDLFERYKSTYSPQQWPAVAAELISRFAGIEKSGSGSLQRELFARILFSEQKYEKLYTLLTAHPEMILDYDVVLLPAYAEEVYGIYGRLIMQQAAMASKRSEYRRVCDLIRRLKSIDGEWAAEECWAELRTFYSRKPAFMDELSKV